MTLSANLIVIVSLGYVVLLFALAWYVDHTTASGGGAWLRSPIIYTLSLSVYCTAWTFYLSLIHISEPTRLDARSRMPSSA